MDKGPVGFFWSGVLTLNDSAEFSFFDVRVRKNQNDATVLLYSVDIPPVPFKKEDNLKVVLYMENSFGISPVKYKVAEAAIAGTSIEGQGSSYNKSEHMLTLSNDTSEWHFMRRDTPGANWLLHCAASSCVLRIYAV